VQPGQGGPELKPEEIVFFLGYALMGMTFSLSSFFKLKKEERISIFPLRHY
jgi:hypothetical protein